MSDTKNHTEWTPPTIALQPVSDAAFSQCASLLDQLTADSNACSEAAIITANDPAHSFDFVLQLGQNLPRLYRSDGTHWHIDFCHGQPRRRAAEHNRANHPIAKALGISKLKASERSAWHIVDGTAGAGADGWQLAAAGATVTLVEQHPVLFTLLHAALHAAASSDDEHSRQIAERVSVLNQHIETVLSPNNKPSLNVANAVYLDPMYPKRRSSAAVKKPMQFIQGLVGPGPTPSDVLSQCLNALATDTNTISRVVVKRPSEAAPLIEPPQWQGQLVRINAGAARFDIYLR